MQNLNLKSLKIIAICLTSLIVICIAVVFDRSPKKYVVPEIEIIEALNNREKIIHHSGEIYCYTTIPSVAGVQHVLLTLPIEFKKTDARHIIEKYAGALENAKLEVYNNKIFFNKGLTQYYDINQKQIGKFCDGELQFMVEPNYFIVLKDGNLYKGRYYPTNYVINHIEMIAEGNFVKCGEDTKRMYYYSEGKTNTLVVGLDKKTLNIIIYDNLKNLEQKLDDVMVTDNYLFEVYEADSEKKIKKISKKPDGKDQYPSEELKLQHFDVIELVDLKYTKPIETNKAFDDVYFYGSVIEIPGDYYTADTLNTKMYKYDAEKDKVFEYIGNLNERSTERYSIVSGDAGCFLYFDGKEITQIPTIITDLSDVSNMQVLNIEIIANYLYYEVQLSKSSGEVDIILAQVQKNGGESERINLPQKK